MLKHFFEPHEEIGQFMKRKGKPVLELKSKKWQQKLAFIVDMTEHLNNLNEVSQGQKKLSNSIMIINNIKVGSIRLQDQNEFDTRGLTRATAEASTVKQLKSTT